MLIPVVSISQKKLTLIIKGGTDVLWSPSMDYTQHVLKEAYSRMGIEFSIEIIKRGYYPKGRGEVKLEVYPSKVKSLVLSKRESNNLKLKCTFSKISIDVIKEKIEKIKEKIRKANFNVEIEIKEEEAIDSGASLLIYSIDKNSIMGVDGLFNNKNKNFDLDFEKFINNSLGVDESLADMLVVPASLGINKTVFQVKEITKHLETNLFVTSKITGCKYGIGKTSEGFEVIIQGVSNSSIK